jgi:hypothetical protein
MADTNPLSVEDPFGARLLSQLRRLRLQHYETQLASLNFRGPITEHTLRRLGIKKGSRLKVHRPGSLLCLGAFFSRVARRFAWVGVCEAKARAPDHALAERGLRHERRRWLGRGVRRAARGDHRAPGDIRPDNMPADARCCLKVLSDTCLRRSIVTRAARPGPAAGRCRASTAATLDSKTPMLENAGRVPVRARPGRLSARSVSQRKSFLYGAFIWERRALTAQTGGFRHGQSATTQSTPDAARAHRA